MSDTLSNDIMFDLVITHDDCSDGEFSAYLAKHYGREETKSAIFLRLKTGEPISISSLESKLNFYNTTDFLGNILIIDIVPTNLQELLEKAQYVQVIDHHNYPNRKILLKLQQQFSNLDVIFNDKKCACQMVWDKYNKDSPYPWMLQVIATNDLKLWETAPCHFRPLWRNIFQGKCLTDEQYDNLFTWSADDLNDSIIEGANQLKQDEIIIQNYMNQAVHTQYDIYNICIALDVDPFYIVPVAERLAENSECDIAMAGDYDEKSQMWILRLRSAKLDVGLFALRLQATHPDIISKAGGHGFAARIGINIDPFLLFIPITT